MPYHFERIVEVWILDQRGNRLQLIDEQDVLWIRGAAVVNGYGVIEVGIDAVAVPSDLITTVDNRFEIWIGDQAAPMQLLAETHWLIRKYTFDIVVRDDGVYTVFDVTAVQASEIATRRIIAYSEDSPQALKTNLFVTDFLKAIFRENCGSLATDPNRDISAIVKTENDTNEGVVLTKDFAWRPQMEVMQELAEAATQGGQRAFFDIVALPEAVAGQPSLEFRSYIKVRGLDRTRGNSLDINPVEFSVDNDNISDQRLTEDFETEVNFVYAGGAGEKDERQIVTAFDQFRIDSSPINRRESFSDMSTDKLDALQNEADTDLMLGQPVRVFQTTVKESIGFRFMIDWFLGDKVNAIAPNNTVYDCYIDAVTFNIESDAFDISTVLRIEEFINAP